MKWDETTASKCRYGRIAGRIFGDAEIIWESSEADCQGHANILAAMPDGTFVHYEWTYGSCSGCDEWESKDMTDELVEAEMRETMAVLKSREICARYLQLDPAIVKGMPYPIATGPTNGSIPGMMRTLFGGRGDDFETMGKAFVAWAGG